MHLSTKLLHKTGKYSPQHFRPKSAFTHNSAPLGSYEMVRFSHEWIMQHLFHPPTCQPGATLNSFPHPSITRKKSNRGRKYFHRLPKQNIRILSIYHHSPRGGLPTLYRKSSKPPENGLGTCTAVSFADDKARQQIEAWSVWANRSSPFLIDWRNRKQLDKVLAGHLGKGLACIRRPLYWGRWWNLDYEITAKIRLPRQQRDVRTDSPPTEAMMD